MPSAVPFGRAAAPGPPEANGLTPATSTIYVNPGDTINNGQSGSTGVAIGENGNVIIGWSDSTDQLILTELQQGVWTMYDWAGNPITPVDTLTSITAPPLFNPASFSSRFRSFYRSDGTPTPNYGGWGPKIKANLFGAGVGMGATTAYLFLEVPELTPIILDDSPPDPILGVNAADIPSVQLLNSDGSKAANVVTGFSDADAQPAGEVRMGDWDYLSDGNILIAGESRQESDLVNRFGGASPGQHVVFRVVQPDGTEVVPLTLASENGVANSMWHGAGVTQGRFALRFDEGGAKVRIFNNDGTPVTGNIDLATLAGNPVAGQGGRGDETGFHGNGNDAFVNVNSAVDTLDGIRKAFVTVLNADGSLRYSRVVSDDVTLLGCSRVDGAIDGSGRVIAVYEDAGGTTTGAKIIQGRLFSPNGTPLAGTFYVSETETPTSAQLESGRPRAAWRGDRIAIAWESNNNPADPLISHVAARFFAPACAPTPEANGLTPVSPTFFVNPSSTINNGGTESLGVAIAANGNVLIGWEDDGDGLTDLEAVWTLYDGAGNLLTTDKTINSLQPEYPTPITSHFLSFFRSDGSAISGRTSWGPKIKANLFGNGMGMGATSFEIGLEITELFDVQVEDGGGPGDFPAVQLLNNDGTPASSVPLTGFTDADAQPAGDVRIADWEYLSDGNVVIVGESRQQGDLVNRFGGVTPANHAAFRIVQPDGTEVLGLTLASENAVGSEMWHGVGVTQGRFAVRFGEGGTAKVRIFNNDGTPVTGNIDMVGLTGNAAVGAGGRGDSTGFHGNASDAYVMANSGPDTDAITKAWVTVLNHDGTLRYSRVVSDDVPLLGSDRVDAAIDTAGRVIALYDDAGGTSNNVRIVRARVFNRSGTPAGCTFYVSELETPATAQLEASRPRAAWRGNKVAVVWESQNEPTSTGVRVLAGRIFTIAGGAGPKLTIQKLASEIVISWTGGGTLESATNVAGPWTPVQGATSPHTEEIAVGTQKYFLLR